MAEQEVLRQAHEAEQALRQARETKATNGGDRGLLRTASCPVIFRARPAGKTRTWSQLVFLMNLLTPPRSKSSARGRRQLRPRRGIVAAPGGLRPPPGLPTSGPPPTLPRSGPPSVSLVAGSAFGGGDGGIIAGAEGPPPLPPATTPTPPRQPQARAEWAQRLAALTPESSESDPIEDFFRRFGETAGAPLAPVLRLLSALLSRAVAAGWVAPPRHATLAEALTELIRAPAWIRTLGPKEASRALVELLRRRDPLALAAAAAAAAVVARLGASAAFASARDDDSEASDDSDAEIEGAEPRTLRRRLGDARAQSFQLLRSGALLSAALMLWRAWVALSGSPSPLVVVLSGSMEPAMRRGDLLLLASPRADADPRSAARIQTGDVVVFELGPGETAVVHRVIEAHAPPRWEGAGERGEGAGVGAPSSGSGGGGVDVAAVDAPRGAAADDGGADDAADDASSSSPASPPPPRGAGGAPSGPRLDRVDPRWDARVVTKGDNNLLDDRRREGRRVLRLSRSLSLSLSVSLSPSLSLRLSLSVSLSPSLSPLLYLPPSLSLSLSFSPSLPFFFWVLSSARRRRVPRAPATVGQATEGPRRRGAGKPRPGPIGRRERPRDGDPRGRPDTRTARGGPRSPSCPLRPLPALPHKRTSVRHLSSPCSPPNDPTGAASIPLASHCSAAATWLAGCGERCHWRAESPSC